MGIRVFNTPDEARAFAGGIPRPTTTEDVTVAYPTCIKGEKFLSAISVSSSKEGRDELTNVCISLSTSGVWAHKTTVIEYLDDCTTAIFVAKE